MSSRRSRTAGRHSCDSPEWYTPPPIVEAGRRVLGAIDLDPASSEEANRIVRARRFYTERENGLRQRWRGRVFLNPPGGLVPAFWYTLMIAWAAGELEAAIWIGYSLEQLQSLQGYDVASPIRFPICIPDRRIAFVENRAKRRERLAKIDAENVARARDGRPLLKRNAEGASPSHANYITYLGANRARFLRVFSEFGEVRV